MERCIMGVGEQLSRETEEMRIYCSQGVMIYYVLFIYLFLFICIMETFCLAVLCYLFM